MDETSPITLRSHQKLSTVGSVSTTGRQKKRFPRLTLSQTSLNPASSSRPKSVGDRQAVDVYDDLEMTDDRPLARSAKAAVSNQPSDSDSEMLVESTSTNTDAASLASSASSLALVQESFITRLFKDSFDLPVEEIAHNTKVQTLFDSRRICWGVQFELARGVSAGFWNWSTIEEKLPELTGTEEDSLLKVESVLLGVPFRVSSGGLKIAYDQSSIT